MTGRTKRLIDGLVVALFFVVVIGLTVLAILSAGCATGHREILPVAGSSKDDPLSPPAKLRGGL
jgi:hypothetical protein